MPIRENGATSGVEVPATFDYDDLGRRTSLMRGNGLATSYDYDGVSRLTSLGLSGSAHTSATFAYNPASQKPEASAGIAQVAFGAFPMLTHVR